MDFEFEDRFRDLMKLTPSEYWRRQCKCTFQFDPISTTLIDDIGVETMMWGSDYPHRWRLARKLEIHRGAVRRALSRNHPQDRLQERRQVLQPSQLSSVTSRWRSGWRAPPCLAVAGRMPVARAHRITLIRLVELSCSWDTSARRRKRRGNSRSELWE
jgi:hypothetical protein